MARKRLRRSINHVRRKGENVFAMPRATRGKNKPKWVKIKTAGLKPNTKYKVMLDNHPGNKFEDITDYSKPTGQSVRNNTHRKGNRGRLTFLKSDANGKLTLKTRPFGTDDATVTGTKNSGSKNFRNMWKFWHTRDQKSDLARDKIKLIAYSSIINPDRVDKIKELKKDLAAPITVEDAGETETVVNPQPRPEDALPPGIICDCQLPFPALIPTDKTVEIETRSNFYQTFFIDASKVDMSETVDLLDITLYVRSKPIIKKNASGLANPGISISILQCESDGTPIITSRYADSVVQLDYNRIKASPLATSGTVFAFNGPLRLKTNRFYAVAINVDDSNYALWMNKKGDLSLIDGIKTEERSQGSSKGHKGDVYYYDKDKAKKKQQATSAWQPKNDLDIKFDVNIAEYKLSTVDVTLHNAAYEFFNVSNTTPDWEPGEEVYKQRSNATGTVYIAGGTNKIVGSGTAFDTALTDGDKIVLTDNTDTTIQHVFTVDKSFSGSATVVYVEEFAERTIGGSSGSPAGTWFKTVVGEVEYYDYYFNNIRLSDSSVNYEQYNLDGDMRFAVGDTIVGVDSGTTAYIDSYNPLPINVFRSNFNASLPPKFKPVTYYNLSEDLGAGVYKLHTKDRMFYLNAPNHVKDYAGWIISASQEVDQTGNGFSGQQKSAEINLQYQYLGETDRSYSAPTIDLKEMDLVTHRWLINNDSTNEHLNTGNALTRHVSTTLELGEGNNAEDIRVIMNAYRPRNTDIEVYAKIHNNADPNVFDDKQWTKLDVISGADKFSKSDSPYDYREMEFSFANTTTTTDLAGTFTTTLNSADITGESGTTDVSTVSLDDIIKISSPLFPENYQLFAVDSVHTANQTITLTESVSNNNIVGEGFAVSTLDAAETGYRNPDNYNSVRYFNASGTPYDTYNRVAIKIVLLADDRKIVPKVDDYRVIGVTA